MSFAERLRITFVLPLWSRKPGGGSRVVYEYANGLAERGHAVTVVHAAVLEPWQYRRRLNYRREPKVLARGLLDIAGGRPGGPPWHRLHPGVDVRYVPNLAARHVPDADVVVATAWRTAESVARYPDSKGRKHYLIQHYETWDAPARRVDATWRAPLRKIVIAEWLEDVGRRLGSVDVVRIANGIDHERFTVVRPVAGRAPRVAMLWSGAPVKGGAAGIAALDEARRSLPDLAAVLFGTGPRPRDLPGWIDYRHNPSQDELVGHIYNGSSIYLCPSLSEGWHLPPAEAMACGCAVVSTDIGGVRDYAIPGETALLAPPGDRGALASRVIDLCRDDALRVRLAEAGNRLIRTFTWDRAVERFEEVVADPGSRRVESGGPATSTARGARPPLVVEG